MFEIFYAIEPSLPPSRKTFQDVNKKGRKYLRKFSTHRQTCSKQGTSLPTLYLPNKYGSTLL